MLRGRSLHGRKFRRQHSVGPYILDFYCSSEHLAVELDGPIHADAERRALDQARSDNLAAVGICVIRFENPEVFERPGCTSVPLRAARY